ncbi:hypothetical protein ACMBCM_08150 [Spiroplasma sp. K1]
MCSWSVYNSCWYFMISDYTYIYIYIYIYIVQYWYFELINVKLGKIITVTYLNVFMWSQF